jgi:phasin family protein
MQNYFANSPMLDMFKNHPMLDMLKKTAENPSVIWEQNMEMMKNFNPMSFLENSPLKSFFSGMPAFAGTTNPLSALTDAHKLSSENAQAVMRRQAEIIQKHADELRQLMQYAMTSHDIRETMNRQSHYMQSTFEALAGDFKELTEMYSKANMETFQAASTKLNEHMKNATKHATTCEKEDDSCTVKAKSSKK